MTTVAIAWLVRFTPCHGCPLAQSGPVQISPEVRKVHVDDRDIGTPAYLNPRKVSTVKKLLELRLRAREFTGSPLVGPR